MCGNEELSNVSLKIYYLMLNLESFSDYSVETKH